MRIDKYLRYYLIVPSRKPFVWLLQVRNVERANSVDLALTYVQTPSTQFASTSPGMVKILSLLMLSLFFLSVLN